MRVPPRGVPSGWQRVAVVHPFPITLDAVAAAILALLAGAMPLRSLAVGGAMLLLQAAIGATNDVVDQAHDRVMKPAKPIPKGLISGPAAGALAVASGGAGLTIAFALGSDAGLLGAAGLGTGLLYDLALKRTVLSWLPYAVGLSLLPAFAWVAARDALPLDFPLLAVLAMLAGAALSLANGLADRPDDVATGSTGLAVRLGERSAVRLLILLQVVLLAGGALGILSGRTSGAGPIALMAAGGLVLAAGTAATGSRLSPLRRHGWEVQAVAIVVLAVALLWATNGPA